MDIQSTRPESAPLRLELADMPELDTPTKDTPPETTATRRRISSKNLRHDQAEVSSRAFGTSPSEADIPPEGYRPAEVEKAARQPHQALVNDLTGLYFALGALLAGANPVAGTIVMEKSADRARELVNACKRNPAALKFLKGLTKSSDLASAVIGHGTMVYAILIAVGRIPLSERSLPLLHAMGYDVVIQARAGDLQGAQYGAPVAA